MVGAVGIELVGQSLSLAESTALTPLHTSKSPLGERILATSWPRIFFPSREYCLPFDCSETRVSRTRRTNPLGTRERGKSHRRESQGDKSQRRRRYAAGKPHVSSISADFRTAHRIKK